MYVSLCIHINKLKNICIANNLSSLIIFNCSQCKEPDTITGIRIRQTCMTICVCANSRIGLWRRVRRYKPNNRELFIRQCYFLWALLLRQALHTRARTYTHTLFTKACNALSKHFKWPLVRYLPFLIIKTI